MVIRKKAPSGGKMYIGRIKCELLGKNPIIVLEELKDRYEKSSYQ